MKRKMQNSVCNVLPYFFKTHNIFKEITWTSLPVHWLRLCTSAKGTTGSVPGWGTEIDLLMPLHRFKNSFSWKYIKNLTIIVKIMTLSKELGGGSGEESGWNIFDGDMPVHVSWDLLNCLLCVNYSNKYIWKVFPLWDKRNNHFYFLVAFYIFSLVFIFRSPIQPRFILGTSTRVCFSNSVPWGAMELQPGGRWGWASGRMEEGAAQSHLHLDYKSGPHLDGAVC